MGSTKNWYVSPIRPFRCGFIFSWKNIKATSISMRKSVFSLRIGMYHARHLGMCASRNWYVSVGCRKQLGALALHHFQGYFGQIDPVTGLVFCAENKWCTKMSFSLFFILYQAKMSFSMQRNKPEGSSVFFFCQKDPPLCIIPVNHRKAHHYFAFLYCHRPFTLPKSGFLKTTHVWELKTK